MIKSREISDYEIIKGCAEYLQISEAEIVSDDYMQEHHDILDVLVNVAINCKKKPHRENMIVHRQMVIHKLECNDIDYTTLRIAEERTRGRMLEDKCFQDVTKIAMSAFCKSKIKKLTIPKNVRHIGAYAFSDSQIEAIHFVCKECEFDHSLFERCRNLKEIILPTEMKRIYENTFGNINAIIEVPESVESIDYNAFAPSSLSKPTGMKPKIRAKAGTLGAEFAKEHGIELILK